MTQWEVTSQGIPKPEVGSPEVMSSELTTAQGEGLSHLSSMQLYFLIVLVLAASSAVLAVVYCCLQYYEMMRCHGFGGGGSQRRGIGGARDDIGARVKRNASANLLLNRKTASNN